MIEFAALVVSLGGPVVALAAMRTLRIDTLGWGARLSFWGIAAVVLSMLVVARGVTGTTRLTGLIIPTMSSLFWGVTGALALFVITGIAALIQRSMKFPIGDHETYDRIAVLSPIRRGFLVLTASFVEEILYRGVGVGIGASLFGGTGTAALISVAAFVGGHFRWHSAHLVQVAVAGIVLTTLYFLTLGDLWSCILAHLIVDGVGFLLVPMLLQLRRQAAERRMSA